MLPKPQDLVLKEKVKLYNNIARINDCEGRLLAELQIYPSPRIFWEFEMLGDGQCNFPGLDFLINPDEPISQLVGYMFSIKEPYSSGSSYDLGPLKSLRGVADKAFFGDINAPAHKFTFYLPNTKFQQESLFQGKLQKIVTETDTGREVERNEEGRYIVVHLDNFWSIRLELRSNALSWLGPGNQNIGALITTVGKLYQPKYSADKPETFSELQTLTLNDSLERLKHLSELLSYANGGYIGPLYVEGQRYSQDPEILVQTTSAVARASQTTSLDRLGLSWNTSSSDLAAYVKCLPTFERMMQHQAWQETSRLVLDKYFQAIQNSPWSVKASAIGTALERLSYTIFVNDDNMSKRQWKRSKGSEQEDESEAAKRLILLLKRIGLSPDRGYSDVDDVPTFIKVRNDATHPETSSLTPEQRWKHINQALQWIDEVILWRLGYGGEYLDRSQRWRSSIAPRYDLGTRDPAW